MTDNQIKAAVDFLAGWLDKASVGCLLVGMFQPDHIFGVKPITSWRLFYVPDC